MLDRLVAFSVHRRGVVLILAAGLALAALFALRRLSVDAVPDVTNVQVQVTDTGTGDAICVQLAPASVERQTLPRSPATTISPSADSSAVKKLPLYGMASRLKLRPPSVDSRSRPCSPATSHCSPRWRSAYRCSSFGLSSRARHECQVAPPSSVNMAMP